MKRILISLMAPGLIIYALAQPAPPAPKPNLPGGYGSLGNTNLLLSTNLNGGTNLLLSTNLTGGTNVLKMPVLTNQLIGNPYANYTNPNSLYINPNATNVNPNATYINPNYTPPDTNAVNTTTNAPR